MDHLHWLTISLLKSGAQAFMPVNKILHAALQGRHIDFSTHSESMGDQVRGTLWLELVQEPEPLLRKRERQNLWTCPCHKWWDLRSFALAQNLLDQLG